MFAYTDPTGTGVLEAQAALQAYRIIVHSQYVIGARRRQSAFTLLNAFDGLNATRATISWIAFPISANASHQEIDARRFSTTGPAGLQDEYVEWRVERNAQGAVRRIIFCTEFPEYYAALASVGLAAVQAGIRDAIPGAQPTKDELFGTGFDPDSASVDALQGQFVLNLPNNPWQNGDKGILCLQQRNNTLEALFTLVADCAVTLPGDPSDACSQTACVPERNSDPRVCTAAQNARRSARAVTLADPAGIRILTLGGIWKLDGQEIDINATPAVWRIERNGRRAVLDVRPDLTLVDDPIETGAQVARVLTVGADVLTAPEADVPAWARTGQESSRQIV